MEALPEGINGPTCSGSTANLDIKWNPAVILTSASTWAGYNDWRQPQYGELRAILASSCVNPLLNATVFPNAQNLKTWTSTEDSTAPGCERFVKLFTGQLGSAPKNADFSIVHLVRGCEYLDPTMATLQTLNFNAAPTLVLVIGKTANVGATNAAANSGNAIVLSTLTPAVCTVATSGVVSLTGAAVVGNSCTIAANQLGRYWDGVNYALAGQTTQSMTVSAAAQSLSFGVTPWVNVGARGTVSATSSTGLLPVTLSSTTLTVCTVRGPNGNTGTGGTGARARSRPNNCGTQRILSPP